MDPAPLGAKLLTLQEELDVTSLHNADKWARENAKRCWADHPHRPHPVAEMSCSNMAWRGCSLGLCEEHCKEVHIDSRQGRHRQDG
jgi:hypothetical protein